MKIGIIDYDLWKRPKSKIFNVEAMKLGTYYEERDCQVDILSPDDDIFLYDKIIFIANNNYASKTERKPFLQHPNISFIGEAFNNGKYVPFNNNEINYNKPQNKFYNNYLKYCFKKKIYTEDDITKMKNKTFVRLFPGASAVDIDKIMTGEKMYVVDTYFFDRENWEETIKYLAVFNRYFSFVNPQTIKNIDDLRNFKKLIDYGFIGLIGKIRIEKMEDFNYFIKEGKDILTQLAPNRFIWEIAYNESNNYTEKFYAQEFYNSLLRVKILNENNIEIHDCAFEDYSNFEFTDTIFRALKNWSRTRNCTIYSFNEYIFKFVKKKRMKDLYLMFLQKHPEYEPLINIIYEKGGK